MLSNEDIKALGRASRVSLDENETALLCRDLNTLLEMAAVLETLPKDTSNPQIAVTLGELREDVVLSATDFTDTGKGFSVPPVMEKT